ncbi:MAG TPA: MoaD/ThiS family protein [Desulfatiglandales bacterium]|jgi:molybdopterin converting factor small subunit|nr:MoaD/ThiS family protein [Desulfatiglandales bacterium]
MKVNVKVGSTFSKYTENLADGKATVKEEATVRDLVKEVTLPLKLVRLIFINGKQGELESVLSEGDTVFFLPPAIGGG